MGNKLSRKAYQQSLPRKRISAGVLLFDTSGLLLIVKPTYKEGWEIPGGTVEANESPLASCTREIREELSLDVRPARLLCVDFAGETETRTESLHFIFYGGVLSVDQIATIRLPADELSEYRLLERDQALSFFKRRLRRRVTQALNLLAAGQTGYLEDEEPVWPADQV